jgi:hypothetical protein
MYEGYEGYVIDVDAVSSPSNQGLDSSIVWRAE